MALELERQIFNDKAANYREAARINLRTLTSNFRIENA
jgi:hypothetical protein